MEDCRNDHERTSKEKGHVMLAFIKEFYSRISYFSKADRIGPDIPTTHWRLHFKSTMRRLCQKKFGLFDSTAEFRPGAYAIYCSNIRIGRGVIVRPGSMLFADQATTITIEDDVMMGSETHIYVSNHRFDDVNFPIINQGFADVILRRGCWIGAKTIILPGVEIGENAVIGAGSVVTKSIPPRVVAVGNPARVIRTISNKGI